MVDVRTIDPTDERLLRSWWEVAHEVALERPVDLWPSWEVTLRSAQVPPLERDRLLLAAFDGDRMVGAARVDMPQVGNVHLGFGELWVRPADRRRGVGAALLGPVEDAVRRAGRTTLLLDVHAPDDVSPGRTFLEGHGYALASIEITKVVDLPETAHLWPALEAHAAERLDGYRLVWFTDPTPEEHVADLCGMFERFLSEIPLGEADIRPHPWDPARLRATEAYRRERGHEHLLVAVQAPTGELVGYTDLYREARDPRIAHINSTLVLGGHRGHRLGLAMKVLLHQQTVAGLPGTELVETGNADVNTHMNAVNDQLGYRAVDRLFEMQKVL